MSTLRTKMDKKKAQDVMKRIMAERRTKDKKPLNIDNPLAKFNSAGQLMCILCSSIVRSEHVWTVHINSKQHRENVSKAKQLKELTNNFTLGKLKHKGLSTPTDAPPEKKIKGILKNSSSAPQITTNKSNYVAPSSIPYHSEEIKRQPLNKLAVKSEDLSESKNDEQVTILQTGPDQPIPEGFFDDPILDAKVRNIEYKDPVEEEWEKFQKEIKEEASASADIIAGEQEEATAARQIDEIDEQIRNWSRVLDLELKKEETRKNKQDMEQMSEEENNDSDNEDDIDEFLDWRAKKSYT